MATAAVQHNAPELGSDKPVDDDLNQLIEWLKWAEQSKPETTYRKVSLEDYKFYANDQDTPEVRKKLEGLKRPCTVYNEIKPKVDMLIGMAAQTKYDTTVVPVGLEDEPLIELMAGALHHFRKRAKVQRKEIECFEHMAKGGRALLFFYIDKSNPFKPVIKVRRYEGRNFFLDPDGQEYDLSDHRFLFTETWLVKEAIEKAWPDFDFGLSEQFGRRGVDEPIFFDEQMQKYRIVEGWYYKYIEVIYFVNPMTQKVEWLEPEEFKQFAARMREGVDVGDGETFKFEGLITQEKSYKKQAYYMIFSGTYKCEGSKSTHNWGGFPAVLYGAYKAYDTNSWFGAITTAKDGQRTLNTNRRQLVHLLQTLPKGILKHEIGAVLNLDDYETKSAEPNFHLEIAKGKYEKVGFVEQPRISPIYSLFDRVLVQSIKDQTGAQDSLMGIQTTGREPGVTVKARQETGIAVLYILFDNYRESRLNSGKIHMSFIQQYVKEETVIRIEGEKGYQLMKINSESNRENEGFNDITAGEFDYEVAETAQTATIKAAIGQMLADFAQSNPDTIPPDVLLEYIDLPFSAKLKVREHWKASQEAAKQEKDREYDLRLKEIEAKVKAKSTKE
jgi:hypothetical protein